MATQRKKPTQPKVPTTAQLKKEAQMAMQQAQMALKAEQEARRPKYLKILEEATKETGWAVAPEIEKTVVGQNGEVQERLYLKTIYVGTEKEIEEQRKNAQA